MTPFLIQYLCEPITKAPLNLVDAVADSEGHILSGELVSPSGRRYPIINGIPRFVHSGFVWDKKTASVTGYVENTPNGLRISPLTEEKVREAAFLGYQVCQDLYLSDEQAKALIEPREEKKVIQPPVIPSTNTEGSSTPSQNPAVTLPVALPVSEGVAVEMLEPEEIEGVEV